MEARFDCLSQVKVELSLIQARVCPPRIRFSDMDILFRILSEATNVPLAVTAVPCYSNKVIDEKVLEVVGDTCYAGRFRKTKERKEKTEEELHAESAGLAMLRRSTGGVEKVVVGKSGLGKSWIQKCG